MLHPGARVIVINPLCAKHPNHLLDAIGNRGVCVILACASLIDTELNEGPCEALSSHNNVGKTTILKGKGQSNGIAELPGCESAARFPSFRKLQYGQESGYKINQGLAGSVSSPVKAAHSPYRRFQVTKQQLTSCMFSLYE